MNPKELRARAHELIEKVNAANKEITTQSLIIKEARRRIAEQTALIYYLNNELAQVLDALDEIDRERW